MSGVPNKWEEGVQAALRALYAPPLSAAELSHYNSLRAAEMARAEARREPSPQLELETP